ncbi:MAG TPA: iron-containing alcohol dehydrogenase [Burkholderiaceae bacterium]|nr:iron-containing alcohol dehydrogenase [Burkholderiaceae bacterium]
MANFTFQTPRRVVVEAGGSHRLGELARPMAGKNGAAVRALIVTDAFLAGSGVLQRARQSLAEAGFELTEFTGVLPDPSEAVVLTAVSQAAQTGVDVVIGMGGGSSLDVAKIVACLAVPGNPLKLSDLYGVESVRAQRLPLVMVPTTAGTGSEVTSIAIVTTGESTKAGIVNQALLADLVLLDARLTLGLPPAVTAATGVDAMVHAIEAYTSVHRKNPMSDTLARQALHLLSANLLPAFDDGSDLAAREAMLLGAMLAGQAFENAPVAAVHALAYPLGGIYHIAHGVSNALVLPHVMRFNREACAPLYAELAEVVMPGQAGSVEARCTAFIDHMASLTERTRLPLRLRDCGIGADAIDALAAAAMGQQRLLKNNPRPVTEADARAIYQAAW